MQSVFAILAAQLRQAQLRQLAHPLRLDLKPHLRLHQPVVRNLALQQLRHQSQRLEVRPQEVVVAAMAAAEDDSATQHLLLVLLRMA
jgi:hypothetical protein